MRDLKKHILTKPYTFLSFAFLSKTTKKPLISINKASPLTSTSFLKHFNYLSMSSLPKTLKDGLESFIELVIPTIIHLKNKIKISNSKCQSKTRKNIYGGGGKVAYINSNFN
jgi:hypothetical protein